MPTLEDFGPWNVAYFMETYIEPFLGIVAKIIVPSIQVLINIWIAIAQQLIGFQIIVILVEKLQQTYNQPTEGQNERPPTELCVLDLK